MYFQWAGIAPFIGLVLMALLVMGGLYLIKKFVWAIHLNTVENTKIHIYRPLTIMLSYSLLLVLFKQAVGFKFVVFTSSNNELLFNLFSSMVTMALALYIMNMILKMRNDLDKRDEDEKKPAD